MLFRSPVFLLTVQGVRWLEHFASRTGEDAEKDQAAVEKEAEAESGMSVVEGDEEVAIEDIEVEDEDEDEEGDDLLAEVEDEEDDVAGIIDPGIAKDEA